MALTEKQRHIHDFLCRFVKRHGTTPTIAEIQRHFHLKSTSSVHHLLSALVNEGYIRRTPNAARGLELVRDIEPSGVCKIPLLGIISAGLPIEAILSHEEMDVPPDMKWSDKTFGLRVRGDSMIGEGILDGDRIAVEPAQTARNKQIVVALINGYEATLKRFKREGNRIYLEPANPRHKTLVIKPPDFVEIQGLYTGLVRINKR